MTGLYRVGVALIAMERGSGTAGGGDGVDWTPGVPGVRHPERMKVEITRVTRNRAGLFMGSSYEDR